jgi:hypothetical protein
MPQIFHRSANAIATASIVGAGVGVCALTWLLMTGFRSDFMTRANVVREQPVPFSHKHHVGGEGFDCRYCHTSVEDSPFAGLPATETCMTCHSQIWSDAPVLEPVRASFRSGKPLQWNRVHWLPGYVYFDHSIHVNKGIGCVTCHGRVDEMPLSWQQNTLLMEWCLECHRQPERFVRPREAVFLMDWKPQEDQITMGRRLVKEYKIRSLTDCYTCHR